MKVIDLEFQSIVKQIIYEEDIVKGRNGTMYQSFYPYTIRCSEAPLVGWRKINHHLGIQEMDWFINKTGEIAEAPKAIQKWWKPFDIGNGTVGDWSYWNYFTDIEQVIEGIEEDPFSRRHVLSSWDYVDMTHQKGAGGLTNCHSTVCQFHVNGDDTLSYKTYQRSADVMIGLPFNLIQHWALASYVAVRVGMPLKDMSYILGNAHIYYTHLKAALSIIGADLPKNDLRLEYSPEGVAFDASQFKIVGACDFPVKEKIRMVV